MIFSSIGFLLYFLPIFLFIYGLTPDRHKNVTLFAGSMIFYALGEPYYLLLLLGSVFVNYRIGRFLGADEKYKGSWRYREEYAKGLRRRKRSFVAALSGNVALLLLIKMLMKGDALPLGVSFYTFQILSYLIDVYRREIPAEHSFVKLATYVTMFPKLVSGPITSYGDMSESMTRRRLTWHGVQNGLKLFTLGLAAKVLLADRVGLLWHDVQVRGFESISTPLAWLGAIAYSLKIYFDFYGYSLMAAGLGKMMGFSLPENFKTPYMARSVREFYRRWHITLGQWFCKYVYIPLGGSREGELRTVRNLLIVWALTGLWHGGSVNYLIWGLLLWLLIVAERQLKAFLDRRSLREGSAWKRMSMLSHLYLWAVIPITWMCFAITDIGELWLYLTRMFGAAPQFAAMPNDWLVALQNYGGLMAFSAIACTPLIKRLYRRFKNSLVMNVILAALFWICVWRIMVEGNNPFMYANF